MVEVDKSVENLKAIFFSLIQKVCMIGSITFHHEVHPNVYMF